MQCPEHLTKKDDTPDGLGPNDKPNNTQKEEDADDPTPNVCEGDGATSPHNCASDSIKPLSDSDNLTSNPVSSNPFVKESRSLTKRVNTDADAVDAVAEILDDVDGIAAKVVEEAEKEDRDVEDVRVEIETDAAECEGDVEPGSKCESALGAAMETSETKETSPTKTDSSKKRGPKRKNKVDDGRPKRPMTAFLLFSQTARPKIQEENPGASLGEISRLLGRMWSNVSDEEKAPHVMMAKENMAKYEIEMEKWKEMNPEKLKAGCLNKKGKKNADTNLPAKRPRGRPKKVVDEESESEYEDEEFPTNVFEVEDIFDRKVEQSRTLYRVRWKGYGPEDDTWEPYENVASANRVLNKFLNNEQKLETTKECAATQEEEERKLCEEEVSELKDGEGLDDNNPLRSSTRRRGRPPKTKKLLPTPCHFDESYQDNQNSSHCKVDYNLEGDSLTPSGRKSCKGYKKPNYPKNRKRRAIETYSYGWNMSKDTMEKLQKQWEAKLQQLKEYKECHGHCNVPQNSKEHPALGKWVSVQRQLLVQKEQGKSKRMTDERKAALDEVGFQWHPERRRGERTANAQQSWYLLLEELRKYKDIHGDCKVPRDYDANPTLGKWVQFVKLQYQKFEKGEPSNITEERFEMLDEIGFELDSRPPPAEQWRSKYDELRNFKEKYGHCDVRPGDGGSSSLFYWVARQRAQYNRKQRKQPSQLTEERQNLLDQLGMRWERLKRKPSSDSNAKNLFLTPMQKRLLELEGKSPDEIAHIAKEGKNENDEDREVRELEEKAAYESLQNRKNELIHEMSEEDRHLLEERDVPAREEQATKDRIWMERLEDLREFKELNGHCRVPKEYPANPELQRWVMSVKFAYQCLKRGKISHLTPNRMKLLEEVGWEFEQVEKHWLDMFDQLKAYKAEHGHCNVPVKTSGPLGTWVATQRRQHLLWKQGKSTRMREDRERMLNEIGFKWSLVSSIWEKRYEDLKAYKNEHGNCLVPDKYEKMPHLVEWVKTQRRQYQKLQNNEPSTLTLERMKLLAEVSFEWTKTGPDFWKQRYAELKKFKAQHGHCVVPSKYDDNPSLGLWVKTQRSNYRLLQQGKPSTMDEDRVRLLEKIGFIWSVKEAEMALKPSKDSMDDTDEVEDMEKVDPVIAPAASSTSSIPVAPVPATPGIGINENNLTNYWGRAHNPVNVGVSVPPPHAMGVLPFGNHYTGVEGHNFEYDPNMVYGHIHVPPSTWGVPPRPEDVAQSMGEIQIPWRNSLDMPGEGASVKNPDNKKGSPGDKKDTSHWKERYDELKHYKFAHGHCLVPEKYKSNPQLGKWVRTQRYQYKLLRRGKKSAMDLDRIQKLERIGFAWSVREPKKGRISSRTALTEAAAEGNPEEGIGSVGVEVTHEWDNEGSSGAGGIENAKVPADASVGGVSLDTGAPKKRGRKPIYGVPKELMHLIPPIDDVEKEENPAMRWQRKLEDLRHFKAQHGHCLVPNKYKPNPPLGLWVKNQRYEYQKRCKNKPSKMSDERVAQLEEIGFVWVAKEDNEDLWQRRYKELCQYKAEHGDTLVSKEYAPIPSLGNWVITQRHQRKLFEKGRSSQINEERIRKLDDIGFNWQVRTRDPNSWQQRYLELKDYKEKRGDCLVRQHDKTYPKLGAWVNKQRFQYRQWKQGKPTLLTGQRIRTLELLGFQWFVKNKKNDPRRPGSEDDVLSGEESKVSSGARSHQTVPPSNLSTSEGNSTLTLSNEAGESIQTEQIMGSSELGGKSASASTALCDEKMKTVEGQEISV